MNHVGKLLAGGALMALSLAGCGIQAAVHGVEQQVGPEVQALDTAIFSVAVAKYQAAQMFKAQIDGTIVLPPLPPPAPVPVVGTPMTPPPVPPPVVTPSGPVVTPSLR